MTLPRSRNTAYAPGSQVKSADLNYLQDWITILGAIYTIHEGWANSADAVEYDTGGTGSGDRISDRVGGGALRGNQLQLITSANTDYARGRTANPVVVPTIDDDSAYVLEFDVDATELDGTGTPALFFGGISALGAYDNNKGCVAFYKNDGSANWFVMHCSGAPGPATTVDTGVAVSSTETHRMRIEWVGAGYTDGPYARFYIDGALVHEADTEVPDDGTDELYVTFDLLQTGVAGGDIHAWVSPFTFRHARTAADGAILINP